MTISSDIQNLPSKTERTFPLNSGRKIIFSLLTLFILVSLDSLIPILVVFLVVTSLILWTGIEIKTFLKSLSVPLAFLTPSIAIIFFIRGTTPVFTIQIMSFSISIMEEGIYFGIILFARALAGVTCLYFLIFTTPIEEIIQFLRKIKTPEILIELLFLSYKLIFEIADKTQKMKKSIDCRLGFNSNKNTIKSLALMLSSLLVDSVNRSVEIDKAMRSRGYAGKVPDTKFLIEKNEKNNSNLVFYGLMVFDVFLISLSLF